MHVYKISHYIKNELKFSTVISKDKMERYNIEKVVSQCNEPFEEIFNIEELTKENINKIKHSDYFIKEVASSLKHVFYFSDSIGIWADRRYIEPNYNILNFLYNKKVKVYLFDKTLYSGTNNDILQEILLLKLGSDNIDYILCNNINMINDIVDVSNENEFKIFIINNINTIELIKLCEIMPDNNSFIYLNNNLRLYNVKYSHNELKIKRI